MSTETVTSYIHFISLISGLLRIFEFSSCYFKWEKSHRTLESSETFETLRARGRENAEKFPRPWSNRWMNSQGTTIYRRWPSFRIVKYCQACLGAMSVEEVRGLLLNSSGYGNDGYLSGENTLSFSKSFGPTRADYVWTRASIVNPKPVTPGRVLSTHVSIAEGLDKWSYLAVALP